MNLEEIYLIIATLIITIALLKEVFSNEES